MRAAVFATLASAALVAAAPAVEKRAAPGQQDIDTVILNYALTLEHLERTFYAEALPSASAFARAGYPAYVRERFVEIGGHEKNHVNFLSTALGDQAVKACTYNFGVTGPQSFIATAQLLEGVGVSAYLGAAQNITNLEYLTAAGAILTVESRHSAWVQSTAAKSDGFGAPYDTPLDFNQVYSLAAPLFKKCPDSNKPLPVMAFPAATISPQPKKLGATFTVKAKGLSGGEQFGFLSGLSSAIVPIRNGRVTIPSSIGYGRTYGIVLKSGASAINDDNTVAGPVVIDILPNASTGASYAQSHPKVGQPGST